LPSTLHQVSYLWPCDDLIRRYPGAQPQVGAFESSRAHVACGKVQGCWGSDAGHGLSAKENKSLIFQLRNVSFKRRFEINWKPKVNIDCDQMKTVFGNKICMHRL